MITVRGNRVDSIRAKGTLRGFACITSEEDRFSLLSIFQRLTVSGRRFAKILCFLCAFALFALRVEIVSAQQTPKIPPEAFEQLAAAMNLSANDPMIRDFQLQSEQHFSIVSKTLSSGFKSRQMLEGIPMPPAPKRGGAPVSFGQELIDLKIKKHLRAAHGVPFPAFKLERRTSEQNASARKALRNFQLGMQQDAQALAETPPLPICLRDTFEMQSPEEADDHWAPGDKEILFVVGEVPPEKFEMFGKTTAVVGCSGKKGDVCAIMHKRLGIDCLPTRLSTRGKTTKRYYGKPALLNYDLKKEGEMHRLTKARLPQLMGVSKESEQ